ncbi:hypothetical protein CY34DRAFT_104486 [Suillus luteus UH-Slu-Lm8-n1]|uniref:Uncharacterized protein n=1 Tax=Suillus luteus UH-Slu-Lm8-n1 TaxID=930992 RepID=A0A0D0BXC6_9AGAM|nr:hypothetical protein CY34DRAFT_104486 [Suillus luteus UH-Slu-Lm8-n1]
MAPHASPSVAPPDCRPTKRPRLSKSTHRVLNVWAQLAERYNKRLDEDDIVDLYSGTIISDRGVLKNGKDYDFGHFTPDDSPDDQDQEQEQEPGEQDQDDDVDELDTLPIRRAPGTDGTMASTSELLRAVPPLSATTDADDLNDFLEAEKRRRELLGDEDSEDDMSMEELAALRKALNESEEDQEQTETETVDPEHAAVIEDESEDELNSIWQHDEASAVYHIARNESEQDVAEASTRFASLTPQTQVYPFATPSVDPTQPPQLLLYQAMHQLSYALSATMLTYGSPHMPPPPTAPWGAYPPGFAHPWGPQGTAKTSHSFTLSDDEHDDDWLDDTPVDHDGSALEKDRRRRRSMSHIGSRNDARKIERRKSARFYEEKNPDQHIVARGRAPRTPSPSISTNKKKSKAKRKS